METAITSSVNWFQPRSIDIKDNILVYISRNIVYIYNINQNGHVTFEKTIVGHQVGINACRFCHAMPNGGDKILLATCDDNGFVRIWNIRTTTVDKIHQSHGKTKVMCLDWSKVNKDLIVTVDEKGLMIVYNYEENKAVKFFPENSANCIQLVTCSPFNENLVCVGFKTGSVSVIDIKGRCSVVMKFRGHNSEIQDIFWPEIMFTGDDINIISENADQWNPNTKGRKIGSAPPKPSQEYVNKNKYDSEWNSDIIVTCCKDKNIRLWGAKDGKFIRMLRTPGRVYQGKRPNDEYSRLYLNVYWSPKHKFKLLSTGYNGEMIVWDLTKPFKDKLQMTPVGSSDIDACHRRAVTSLCPGSDPDTLFTSSVDRTVKCWNDIFDKTADRPIWTLPTVGGYIHKIQVCPTDPTMIAFGSGDGSLRVWQTNNPHDRYDMISLFQKTREKISAISWHPTLGDIIAFATEDGKVGCFNISTPGISNLSSAYHLKVVYCLRWGPRCYRRDSPANDTTDMCLFSCGGDGVVLMHQSSIANVRPRGASIDQHWSEREVTAVKINNLLKDTNKDFDVRYRGYNVTEFAWNHNYKFLAIGDYRGSILIFSTPHLQQLIEISSVYRYMVNTLEWGPPLDEKSSFWLASGSREELVAVFDLNTQLSGLDVDNIDTDREVVPIKKATRSLVGHKSRITTLAWSPIQSGLLASGSFDGTVQIWNVYQDIPIANFRKHTSRVLTVCWTQIRSNNGEGEEMLFSGGEDYSLHSWCYSKLAHKLPPKVIPPWCMTQNNYKKMRNQQQKNDREKVKESGTVDVMNDETMMQMEINVLLERKKNELLKETPTQTAQVDTALKKFLEETVSEGRNLFASNIKVDDAVLKNSKIIPKNMMSDPQFVFAGNKRIRPRTFLKLAQREEDSGIANVCGKLKNAMLTRLKERDEQNGMRTSTQQQVVELQQNCEDGEKTESTDSQQEGKVEKVEPFLYGSRKSMLSALEAEEDNLLNNHTLFSAYHPYHIYECYASIKLWKGEIVDLIDNAISSKRLNDQLVNYSIMISYDYWLKICKLFAQQLYEDKYYLRASNYYIACNMLEKAVKTLIDGTLFREAFSLARLRFGDESKITKYASECFKLKRQPGEMKMSIPVSAAMGIFSGDIEESAERLHGGMYRNNKEKKENSVELNLEYGVLSLVTCRLDDDVTMKKLVTYTNDCLNECCGYEVKWKSVHQIADKIGLYVLSFRMIISAHELLVNTLNMTDDEKISYFSQNYEQQSSPLFQQRTKTDSLNEQYQQILSSLIKVDGYTDEKVKQIITEDMKKIIEHSHTIYDDNLTFRHILVQLATCLAAANIHRFYKSQQENSKQNDVDSKKQDDEVNTKDEDEIKNLLIKFTKHQSFIGELQENVVDIYNGVENNKIYANRTPIITPVVTPSTPAIQHVTDEIPTPVVPDTPAQTEEASEAPAQTSPETQAPTEESSETPAQTSLETPAQTEETTTLTETSPAPETPTETEESPETPAQKSLETPTSAPETSTETPTYAETLPKTPDETPTSAPSEETLADETPEEIAPKTSQNGSENENTKDETPPVNRDEESPMTKDETPPVVNKDETPPVVNKDETPPVVNKDETPPVTKEETPVNKDEDENKRMNGDSYMKLTDTNNKNVARYLITFGDKSKPFDSSVGENGTNDVQHNGNGAMKTNGTNGHSNGVATEISETVGDIVTGASGRIINPPSCKLNNNGEDPTATTTTDSQCQQT